MMADEILVKTPIEERLFDFDFTLDLDEGEILGGTPTITINPGGQLAASAIVVSGSIVQARYTGGTAATTYHVSCVVETSTQIRELCGDLEVVAC